MSTGNKFVGMRVELSPGLDLKKTRLETISEALEFEGPFTADRYEIEKIVKGEA